MGIEMEMEMEEKTVIDKLVATGTADRDELIQVLQSSSPEAEEYLFAAARRVREEYFGKKIFLYGFVYFSTWCRNNCSFCYYRRDNKDSIRYRKTNDEVLAVVKELKDSGVVLADLTLGEDPLLHKEHFLSMVELVKAIKRDYELPVMISPGVIDDGLIEDFAAAGTDFYALYQETYNRELFAKLRLEQDFDRRLNAKLTAKKCGIHFEDGLMTGLGETVEDLADALLEMQKLGASQLRIMTFVPQEGTPMSDYNPSDSHMECRVIALLRLMNHKVLIPASLDVEGINGLESRINAGCNVVTSLIAPSSGMAGVAQSTKDVNEGYRTVKGVAPRLQALGLEVASVDEYKQWLKNN